MENTSRQQFSTHFHLDEWWLSPNTNLLSKTGSSQQIACIWLYPCCHCWQQVFQFLLLNSSLRAQCYHHHHHHAWAVFVLGHTECFAFRPNSSKTLFEKLLDVFTCLLANSRHAYIWVLLRSFFLLDNLPQRLDLCRAWDIAEVWTGSPIFLASELCNPSSV